MLALFGVIGLVVFVFLRPHEFVEILQDAPMLYVFVAIAAVGVASDAWSPKSPIRAAPQLRWVLAFWAWCVVSLAVKSPDALGSQLTTINVSMAIFLLIGHGLRDFGAFERLATVQLAITLALASFGTHQGMAPFECLEERKTGANVQLVPDGRDCETAEACSESGAVAGATYRCEKVGVFGTTSIGGGRVRYRGVLEDPNELALATGIGIPLAFALRERRRTAGSLAVLLVTVALVIVCIVLTKSRGGQLVIAAALGAYFVKKQGIRGLLLGAVLLAPVLIWGGRGGESASDSAVERTTAVYEGLMMFRGSPVFGVGHGEFLDHYYMTAHNSYVLALAELGLPGLVLFVGVLYISTKIAFAAMRREDDAPEVEASRAWGMALVASFAGLSVGIFFLSLTYHFVLWTYVGLTAALHSSIRAADDDFRVRVGFTDLAAIGGLTVAVLGVAYALTKVSLV